MDTAAFRTITRPKLALWMFQRGLLPKHAAPELGVGREQVRRYCLPFGDPLRAIPTEGVMERIVAWTRGEITPADFYPPKLFGKPADEDWHTRDFLNAGPAE